MPLELQKCLRKLNQPTEQRSVNPFCPENAQIFTQKITNSYGKFEKYTCPLKAGLLLSNKIFLRLLTGSDNVPRILIVIETPF